MKAQTLNNECIQTGNGFGVTNLSIVESAQNGTPLFTEVVNELALSFSSIANERDYVGEIKFDRWEQAKPFNGIHAFFTGGQISDYGVNFYAIDTLYNAAKKEAVVSGFYAFCHGNETDGEDTADYQPTQTIAERLVADWQHLTIAQTQAYLEEHAIEYTLDDHSGHGFEPYLMRFADNSKLAIHNWENEAMVGEYSLAEFDITCWVDEVVVEGQTWLKFNDGTHEGTCAYDTAMSGKYAVVVSYAIEDMEYDELIALLQRVVRQSSNIQTVIILDGANTFK